MATTSTSTASLRLRIVSPEGIVAEQEADSVVFPGEDGLFGILPRHAAMVSLTVSGVLKAKSGGETVEYLIHEGFAQVRDDVVTVLTRSCEKADEIDLERAKRAAERAMDRLRAKEAELDLSRAQHALQRALLREKMARHHSR